MISYNFPAVEFFPRSHHPLLCHRYFRHLAVGFSIQECISFLFSLCFPLSGFLKHTTCKVGRFIKYLYGKHAINDSSVFIKQFIGFFPRFNSLFRKKMCELYAIKLKMSVRVVKVAKVDKKLQNLNKEH